ncbi:Bacterial PH domain protein [uncultured archaeon]|nr:Bacterial PH domain protein [uncultured archaeon]
MRKTGVSKGGKKVVEQDFGGGLLLSEGRQNFCSFAPNAQIGYVASSLWGTLIVSVILFPLILILPLTLTLTLFYSVFSLRKFIFILEKRNLLVRRGIIKYSYSLIPYENIQDIHVTQTFVERLFGMWSVTVFTATIGGGAVSIPALDKTDAEKLKDALFTKMKEAKNVTD